MLHHFKTLPDHYPYFLLLTLLVHYIIHGNHLHSMMFLKLCWIKGDEKIQNTEARSATNMKVYHISCISCESLKWFPMKSQMTLKLAFNLPCVLHRYSSSHLTEPLFPLNSTSASESLWNKLLKCLYAYFDFYDWEFSADYQWHIQIYQLPI